MNILVVGYIKNIVDNLERLGATVISQEDIVETFGEISGIITTKKSSIKIIRRYYPHTPIIVSGKPGITYKNIDVLVLDEEEVDAFYKKYKLIDIKKCKDILKELMIKHLVISLNKKTLERNIIANLPSVKVSDVLMCDEDVENAKDIITALIGYAYIKQGGISPKAINEIGYVTSMLIASQRELTNYRLHIKLRGK